MIDQTTVLLVTPLITAMVEAAKKAGLPTNAAGPAALVFAFALTALVAEDPYSRDSAITAIAAGLAAAGLYSQLDHYLTEATPDDRAADRA